MGKEREDNYSTVYPYIYIYIYIHKKQGVLLARVVKFSIWRQRRAWRNNVHMLYHHDESAQNFTQKTFSDENLPLLFRSQGREEEANYVFILSARICRRRRSQAVQLFFPCARTSVWRKRKEIYIMTITLCDSRQGCMKGSALAWSMDLCWCTVQKNRYFFFFCTCLQQVILFQI